MSESAALTEQQQPYRNGVEDDKPAEDYQLKYEAEKLQCDIHVSDVV